jgi:N-acetylglutamate synthase-like GNAT family acetyltransferase
VPHEARRTRKLLSAYCGRFSINNSNHAKDLVLREAIAFDEPSIFRLIREANINPTGVRWQRFVVVEDDSGKVVGCGQVKPHRDGTNELASLVVDPAWREKGLARRILEYLIEHNEGPLYLMCASHLGVLYEKFGFYVLEDGDLPKYFRRIKLLFNIPEKFLGMSLLIMRRDADSV